MGVLVIEPKSLYLRSLFLISELVRISLILNKKKKNMHLIVDFIDYSLFNCNSFIS